MARINQNGKLETTKTEILNAYRAKMESMPQCYSDYDIQNKLKNAEENLSYLGRQIPYLLGYSDISEKDVIILPEIFQPSLDIRGFVEGENIKEIESFINLCLSHEQYSPSLVLQSRKINCLHILEYLQARFNKLPNAKNFALLNKAMLAFQHLRYCYEN